MAWINPYTDWMIAIEDCTSKGQLQKVADDPRAMHEEAYSILEEAINKSELPDIMKERYLMLLANDIDNGFNESDYKSITRACEIRMNEIEQKTKQKSTGGIMYELNKSNE